MNGRTENFQEDAPVACCQVQNRTSTRESLRGVASGNERRGRTRKRRVEASESIEQLSALNSGPQDRPAGKVRLRKRWWWPPGRSIECGEPHSRGRWQYNSDILAAAQEGRQATTRRYKTWIRRCKRVRCSKTGLLAVKEAKGEEFSAPRPAKDVRSQNSLCFEPVRRRDKVLNQACPSYSVSFFGGHAGSNASAANERRRRFERRPETSSASRRLARFGQAIWTYLHAITTVTRY